MKQIIAKIVFILLLCVNAFASNYDQQIISDKKCKIYDDIDYLSNVGFSFSSGDFKITTRILGKLSCEFALPKELFETKDFTNRKCHCFISENLTEEDIAFIFKKFVSNWDEDNNTWTHSLKSAKLEINEDETSRSITLHIGSSLKLFTNAAGELNLQY